MPSCMGVGLFGKRRWDRVDARIQPTWQQVYGRRSGRSRLAATPPRHGGRGSVDENRFFWIRSPTDQKPRLEASFRRPSARGVSEQQSGPKNFNRPMPDRHGKADASRRAIRRGREPVRRSAMGGKRSSPTRGRGVLPSLAAAMAVARQLRCGQTARFVANSTCRPSPTPSVYIKKENVGILYISSRPRDRGGVTGLILLSFCLWHESCLFGCCLIPD
jgi:hypothetical protein